MIATAPILTLPKPKHARDGRDHFVLNDLNWAGYQHFLQMIGDRSVRHTYDRGRLELMSPLPIHEIYKTLFGHLLDMLVIVLGIRVKAVGSTTFGREDVDRGLEPDTCFYLKNAARIRDWSKLSLDHDPPPDLAIEVDNTTSSLDRLAVYAALRVPEVWRFDGDLLTVYRLEADGNYEVCDRSPGLLFLPMEEVPALLQASVSSQDDLELLQMLRKWVEERVAPRFKNP
jgi:Uma2 family endonuclease